MAKPIIKHLTTHTPHAASRFSNRHAGDPTRLADGPPRLSCLGSNSRVDGSKRLASTLANDSRLKSNSASSSSRMLE